MESPEEIAYRIVSENNYSLVHNGSAKDWQKIIAAVIRGEREFFKDNPRDPIRGGVLS